MWAALPRITNLDIPADCIDAFDADEDDPDPIEDGPLCPL